MNKCDERLSWKFLLTFFGTIAFLYLLIEEEGIRIVMWTVIIIYTLFVLYTITKEN